MQHMLNSHNKDAEGMDKAEGGWLHATHDVTGLPKTLSKDKSGHSPVVVKVAQFCTSLFYGRTAKNYPLGVLLNNPWHSSSLHDSIFYHKGSRRVSGRVRILTELGIFQGLGLIGPFGLCRGPGI